MKTMTIEQKAKTYDEVIKFIKHVMDRGEEPILNKADIYAIFPELKESEDERIKGAIMDYLKDNNLTEWAAWLEKQGEKEYDPRYKYLSEILAADDIYQMAVNYAMVDEARAKAVNALSKMCIGELLVL